ncbi:hypothetical protein [Bradyrhizobium sp. NP1]|uniref:hypothetical protein n=1 Tax=Bradyrhizobium sp. NP1 TaxID=3049772 RepID=UPI0025A537E3|nr:hypothetical protein [Bradyrhizobium sp. NP1]WJR78769.1 hypothetical protein QOU61_02870 [Bradyrhizobium sp. NP1]
MLALSPEAENIEPAPTTCSGGAFGDPCHLWVAINQALGDIDDWAERYTRCTFADRERGTALLVEKVGNDRLRVCRQKQRATLGLQNAAVWFLTLDAGTVCDVTFDGASADIEAMEELADLLWAFHRLAVEDRVPVLRE